MSVTSVVLDTSVYVAAVLAHEDGHRAAARLMTSVREEGVTLVLPSLLIPELMGALRRNKYSPLRIRQLVRALRDARGLVVPLDLQLAELAGEVAISQAVKGSDSVFLALARSLAVPLLTLDREQLERAPADVEVLTPEQALAKWWPA